MTISLRLWVKSLDLTHRRKLLERECHKAKDNVLAANYKRLGINWKCPCKKGKK